MKKRIRQKVKKEIKQKICIHKTRMEVDKDGGEMRRIGAKAKERERERVGEGGEVERNV